MNGWAELMAAAGATPRLERAACKGRAELFDLTPDSPAEAADRAKGICHGCPALTGCRAWLDATPPHLRPVGMVAGELLGPPPPAPRIKTDPADDDRWLTDYLTARRGRAAAAQVLAAGKAAGIHDTRLRAARRRIGAKVNTSTGPTWYLPERVAS